MGKAGRKLGTPAGGECFAPIGPMIIDREVAGCSLSDRRIYFVILPCVQNGQAFIYSTTMLAALAGIEPTVVV